jgi:phosphate:Na+ symporter
VHTFEPTTTFSVIALLLGGVALFLLGTEWLVGSFQRLCGPMLRGWLSRLGRHPLAGLAVGTATAALILSGPTTVLIMGLVNAGVVSLAASLALLAGANIGTTLAMQVIALEIGRSGFLLAAAGVVLRIARREGPVAHAGGVAVGLGMMFIGLEVMKASLYPLRESEELIGAVATFTGLAPMEIVRGVLAGAALAAMFQSSGAAISLLFTLASLGVLRDVSGAVPVILGIQVGKCLPVLLASIGGSRQSLQIVAAHVGFNLMAVVVGLVTLPLAARWMSAGGSPVRMIANYNTLLMIATAVVVLPVRGRFAATLQRLPIGRGREMVEPSRLEDRFLATPERAIHATILELRRQGGITALMLRETLDALVSLDMKKLEAIRLQEDSVDIIRHEIERYLRLIGRRRLLPRQIIMLQRLTRVAGALERTGDHIESLGQLIRRKTRENIWFDDEAMNRLLAVGASVRDMLDETVQNIDPDHAAPEEAAQRVLRQRQAYKDISREARTMCRRSLPAEGGEGASALLYIQMLHIFDKIVSHLKETARQELGREWTIDHEALDEPEPLAGPPPRRPATAIIDPNFETATRRLLPVPPPPAPTGEATEGKSSPGTPAR